MARKQHDGAYLSPCGVAIMHLVRVNQVGLGILFLNCMRRLFYFDFVENYFWEVLYGKNALGGHFFVATVDKKTPLVGIFL